MLNLSYCARWGNEPHTISILWYAVVHFQSLSRALIGLRRTFHTNISHNFPYIKVSFVNKISLYMPIGLLDTHKLHLLFLRVKLSDCLHKCQKIEY